MILLFWKDETVKMPRDRPGWDPDPASTTPNTGIAHACDSWLDVGELKVAAAVVAP